MLFSIEQKKKISMSVVYLTQISEWHINLIINEGFLDSSIMRNCMMMNQISILPFITD